MAARVNRRKLTQLWAWIGTNEDGSERIVLSSALPIPLVTGDRNMADLLEPAARETLRLHESTRRLMGASGGLVNVELRGFALDTSFTMKRQRNRHDRAR